MTLTFLIVLNAVAAALPIIAFGRLLWRAQRTLNELEQTVAQRGHSTPTVADLDRMIGTDVRASARHERGEVVVDISLVGVGLIAGAAANIWSLFL
jgi:hypothetical protein